MYVCMYVCSTPNNFHMNKEVNLALMYRKMGMRHLLLFMAGDTSGKIIINRFNQG